MIKKIYESRVELSRKKVPHVYRFNLSRREANGYLFIQPDVVQLLVKVMARSNLPAFDIGPVGIDLVPP